ncbi:hypothetical protein LJR125_000853 [Pseudoxanthomonas sp. LjRoot125]|uniref:AbiJ-NTD4 domain-containing protein n=1 Tax=Pseudoxanthomonas sp. LjRoot125 TaxID=3342258 RepID=UPI003E11C7BB
MLTDIFAARYRDFPIWPAFGHRDIRLFNQAFQILDHDVLPYYKADGSTDSTNKEIWRKINASLCRELGVSSLSPTHYQTTSTWSGVPTTQWNAWPYNAVASTYVCADLRNHQQSDIEAKERMSLIEIGMRAARDRANMLDATYPPPAPAVTILAQAAVPRQSSFALEARRFRAQYETAVVELNARFEQAGVPLVYNNGHIQVNSDATTTAMTAEPFWRVISNPRWSAVDVEMRDAIDRRDSSLSDAAFHATKSLESAIKVVSAERGWTTGRENGAASFIDNLVSQANGRFIEVWQADALKQIFREVRNPLGHGAGVATPSAPTGADTNWAISICMAWIRWLVQRHQGDD